MTAADGADQHVNGSLVTPCTRDQRVAVQDRAKIEHANPVDSVLADEENGAAGGMKTIQLSRQVLHRVRHLPGTGRPNGRAYRRLDAMSRTDPVRERHVAGPVRSAHVVRRSWRNRDRPGLD